MPWSVTRMLFESRAEAHDAYRPKGEDEARDATQSDINGWI